ncbi:FAD-dependent monooxygenase [Streptomyces sp. NPDC045714]|uniref:FAD-dependent oxidoreductase n=1 Tax=Streptomyces sp. NPDC045714 TaxID=3154913 RepID=UPI0033CC7CE3
MTRPAAPRPRPGDSEPGSALPPPAWDRAVVLGGGYAGLLAARVLTGHFRQVTVIERDPPPAPGEPATRPGVPQAHHPHALLARGAEHLEELFPGLREELAARGCPVEDFAAATRMLFPTGWAPRTPVGFDVQLVARPALEQVLRERVTALPSVAFRYGVRAEALLLDQQPGGVGVTVRPRDAEGRDEVIQADLVVDATGRATRLPRWLADAGYSLPDTLVVDGKVTYASRFYTFRPDPGQDWFASYQPTLAPHSPRGGVAARVGPDLWQLGLIGAGGQAPPADEDGFRAYAAALDNPDFAHIIDNGTPQGPVRQTRSTVNRWHRYDRLPRWPGRLIALGDSICALNPVYAQGMTVAARQATLLDSLLTRHAHTARTKGTPGALDRLGPAFQRQAAALARGPWLLNTSADRAWQPATAPLGTRIATRYLAAVTARLPHHPALFLRFARSLHMLDGPAILATPRALAQLASLPSLPRHEAVCTCPAGSR